MKRRVIVLFVIIALISVIAGCTKGTEASREFKREYEALNGMTNASGKEHRTVSIVEDNPFEKVTAKEILDKIENGETFYVYFGDELCPWCRSVIEKAIEVAKNNNINKIYYVKIWDSEGSEVLRSKYKLDENNNIETVIEGTKEYKALLQKYDSLLSTYTLTDSEGNKIDTGEKRIYAPNFIYVKEGVATKLTEGISDKQTDSRQELTDEILTDEESLFEEFFNN